MEGNPNQEGLSFEEELILAKRLSEATDVRNNFVEMHGGFDDFADIHQHVENNRAEYDKLWADYNIAREEFDQKVKDKKIFVQRLYNMNSYDLANRISEMFAIKRDQE